MNRVIKAVVVAVIMVLALFARDVFASFSLSVTPYEGTVDLRFGNVSNTDISRIDKQVNVAMTCTDNKQYRLYQNLLEPLRNEKGEALPQNNFVFNVLSLSGKPQYGSVVAFQEQPVAMSRALIYTSNTNGSTDNLVLSYGIKLDANVHPGYYSGRIAYTLEELSSNAILNPQILNVYVEIDTKVVISVTTASGSKVIALNSVRDTAQVYDVSVDVKSNMGGQYKIYQLLSSPLMSGGLQLPPGAVTFSVRGGDKGQKEAGDTNLSLNRQLVYASGPQGLKDSFTITYKIGNLTGVKSGKYRGMLQYIIESGGAEGTKTLESFDIELENEEVFNIAVTLGPLGRIDFDNLKVGDKPKTSEVFIDVKTNAGQPYQVIQTVSSTLVSKTGDKIPPQNFTLKTETIDNIELPGLKFPTATEVKPKDTVLYVSDKKGSPASFKVTYELSIPDTVKPENYGANISYSLIKIQ